MAVAPEWDRRPFGGAHHRGEHMGAKATEGAAGDWIAAAEVRAITGATDYTIDRLVEDGLLTVRQLPRGNRRFLRGEVEALAQRYTRYAEIPAKAGVGEVAEAGA
jgi:hypothetical protein